jgi:plastocyanin
MRGRPKATLALTETGRDELLALLSPDTLTVKRGDTAMWVNKDPFPHTVTAVDGAFDSKSIDADKSWKYVAKRPEEYRYTCTFHSTMKAALKE